MILKIMKDWGQMGPSAHMNYYMASLGLQESLKWHPANQGVRAPKGLSSSS